jgi:tungstate transport system substrate-binding protein
MRFRLVFLGLFLLLIGGCGPKSAPSITLATTTSVQDTGLLDRLLPMFREETGIEVKVVAVGTGQALELGRRGDADVLIVHDPESEKQFMDEGHGALRRQIMHNDFVIVGPRTDPAGLRSMKLRFAAAAFQHIAMVQATFVSRGDESGTHLREKLVWRVAGITPSGNWYIQGGGGMAAILRLANEKRAYTLTDRGTYLSQRDKLDLVMLLDRDPLLLNTYSVIVVTPGKDRPEYHDRAQRFAEFLVAPATQKVIGEFGVDRFGQPLFISDADLAEDAMP